MASWGHAATVGALMDMPMNDRVPDWVTPLAWVFLALSLASTAAIAVDVLLRGHRQHTRSLDVVWICSGLYLGPFALLLWRRHRDPADRTDGALPTAVEGLPGGSASALAHLVGVPLVVASGLTIAGIDLWVMILVIGALAIALLVVHERATLGTPVGTAAFAAVLTVLAFDVGMGGWMVLLHLAELMPPASEGAFWFLMQLGVVLGLVTGYPVVRWLAERRGVATA